MLPSRQLNFAVIVGAFLFMFLQNVRPTGAEFYTSIYEMTKLVRYEEQFVRYMQRFIEDNESKLDILKARLGEFERENEEALEEGLDYFDSPVNKYLLTKRLTVDWERIENLMAFKAGEKSLQRLEQYQNKRVLPDENELSGAAEGLLRLQDIYRLKTQDIAAGVLQGVAYNTQLEARHCYNIGQQAIKLGKILLGHAWFEEALRRLPFAIEELDDNVASAEEVVDRSDILLSLADAKRKLGDAKGANETYTELLQQQPDNERAVEVYEEFLLEFEFDMPSRNLTEEHEPIPADLYSTSQADRYKYTCSGHITPTPSDERDLRCGYLTETHPFLLLAPIKVEEMHHDPLLVVFHEVISDKEIEIVRGLTNKIITRATVMGLDGATVSPVRTSQFAFIPKTTHKVLQTIDDRVEDMTNLNQNYIEDHQFANYGIGGHYSEHFDFFVMPREELVNKVAMPEMGNRIATVLFYLSDVEQGGGTAFPYMKRLLMPKKGDAAFWYNLHASGDGDERTLHGACPIIAGSKWVQNRWIRETFQDDRRPCYLFHDKVFGPF